jgi:acetyl esterase/lipase
MKPLLLILALAAAAALPAAEPTAIPLWPEGVPGLHADAAEEKIVNHRIAAVHYPSLLRYAPTSEKSAGTALVYCPGGGYTHLSPGAKEIEFFTAAGATVFILKYRMIEYGQPAPLQDVVRAVRLIRSRAAELGVRPDRIGVFGQSAGGHLAACAATLWDAPEARTGAPLDAVSARPDFAALVYPVITMAAPFAHAGSRDALLGHAPAAALIARYSIEQHVRKDMPPVLLVATMADKTVPVENTLHLYQALRDAGVPSEMHVYAQGAHGDSLDPQYGPTALWMQRMAEWMRFNGWLAPASAPVSP